MGILDTLLMIAAVVLIILSLLQSGKSDGLGSAFGGSEGLNLFANVKERGSEKVMSSDRNRVFRSCYNHSYC